MFENAPARAWPSTPGIGMCEPILTTTNTAIVNKILDVVQE